jgi:hypothetical protein
MHDEHELSESPWLEPFIEDGDDDLEPARRRYNQAVTAAHAQIRATGQTVYKRQYTTTGAETTALITHPKGSSG